MYNKMKGGTVMMNDNARSLIVGATALVTGLCVGVGTGVLFAPHSGARTRRYLKSFAEDMAEDTAETIDKVMERGKRLVAM
jgi:gas vesicle protein